jgi:hypothetical protein
MAQQPKKRKRKVKRKVKIKKRVAIVRKDSVQNDTLKSDTFPRMKAQMPRSNGMVLKVKLKRK